jgi:hypothetical protein
MVLVMRYQYQPSKTVPIRPIAIQTATGIFGTPTEAASSLLSENLGIEDGRDLQNASSSIANLDCEPLANRAFHNRVTGSVDKCAQRQIVRRLGVR